MIKPQRLSVSSGVRTTGILFAVIFVLYAAREIFVPLAFAITLALILSPAVAWLQKIRMARVPAVALVMLVTIALACGTAWVIFNQLVEVANELPSYRQNIDSKLKTLRTPGKGALGRATESVKELSKELSASSSSPARRRQAVSRSPRCGGIGPDLQRLPADLTKRSAKPAFPSGRLEPVECDDSGHGRCHPPRQPLPADTIPGEPFIRRALRRRPLPDRYSVRRSLGCRGGDTAARPLRRRSRGRLTPVYALARGLR